MGDVTGTVAEASAGARHLDGKVVLVAGAAGDLGEAITRALAVEGATLAVCDADPTVVAAIEQRSAAADVPALGRAVDPSQPEDLAAFVAEVCAREGGVDVLVCSGAVRAATPLRAPRAEALAAFDEVMAVNVLGPLVLQRAVTPSMIGRCGGDIVLLTSREVLPPADGGDVGSPGTPDSDVHDASRWALNGFTQGWALLLARHHVRVNALAVAEGVAPAALADALVALLREGPGGRSGETVAVRADAPVTLPARRPRGADLLS